jgi:Tol biopolymer transport system component
MIVFARDKTYKWGGLAANWAPGGVICLIRSDGRNERQLTADDTYAFEPRFLADGKSVIFSARSGRASVPIDGSASPRPIPGPPGAIPSPDAKLLAYSKGQYSPDLKLYVANSDGSSERLLTPNVGGCYRPMFSRAGDRLFFLREEWPDGPTGTPKFSVWEAAIDGTTTQPLTDYHLFDDPLVWKPKGTR